MAFNNKTDLENKYIFEEIEIKNRDFENKIFYIIDNHEHFKNNKEINFLSIAIDAKWGYGKTTFVKEIENKYKDECIYFNCWKHDFLNNPIYSIYYEFSKKFNKKKINKILKKILKYLKQISINFNINLFPCFGFNFNLKDIKNEFDIFHMHKNNIKREIKNGKLILIVDELDRCKPFFAIELIEIFKHLFNMKEIIIIWSINWNDFHNSINYKYGINNDKSNEFYLDKIIDWRFELPNISRQMFLDKLVSINLNKKVSKDAKDEFINFVLNELNLEKKSLREIKGYFLKWLLNWKIREKEYNFPFDVRVEKILFECIFYKKIVIDEKILSETKSYKQIVNYMNYIEKELSIINNLDYNKDNIKGVHDKNKYFLNIEVSDIITKYIEYNIIFCIKNILIFFNENFNLPKIFIKKYFNFINKNKKIIDKILNIEFENENIKIIYKNGTYEWGIMHNFKNEKFTKSDFKIIMQFISMIRNSKEQFIKFINEILMMSS